MSRNPTRDFYLSIDRADGPCRDHDATNWPDAPLPTEYRSGEPCRAEGVILFVCIIVGMLFFGLAAACADQYRNTESCALEAQAA